MSKWTIIICLPQIIMCFVAMAVAFKSHGFGSQIHKEHPRTGCRMCAFAHGVVFLSLAYVFSDIYWASEQPAYYVPTMGDIIQNAWDLLVIVHFVVWCNSCLEAGRDRLSLVTKPCRPCPWRGEEGAPVVVCGCGTHEGED